jgi:hypothetical protein
MPSRTTLELVALLASLAGEAATLLFVDNATLRLTVGLLLLAVIVWSSSRLGVADLLNQSPVRTVQQRRFVRLRSQVQQLLDEIRRLNWMAVDAERGFRNRNQALEEMDAIEERLRSLIAEIRSTAGQTTSVDRQ